MLNDLLLLPIWRRQVIETLKIVVLQPENVQAGLVAGGQVFVFKIFESFALFSLVTVVGVVAVDKVAQVVEFEGAGLQREMLVRS